MGKRVRLSLAHARAVYQLGAFDAPRLLLTPALQEILLERHYGRKGSRDRVLLALRAKYAARRWACRL